MTPDIIFDFGSTRLTFDFPRGIELFGWTFYWYGAIIAVGFLVAMIYAYRRKETFGIRDDSITDMALFAVPCAIIGARVYYMIFSEESWTFITALQIWNGGLAIYGGVIGGFIGTMLFSLYMRHKLKRKEYGAVKFKISPYMDIGALGLLIGQTVGRWGNFANREAYGSETNLPWAMGLSFDTGIIWVHPTFLYESLWNLIGLIWMHIYSKRRKFDGEIFSLYLGWYGIGRFFVEALRTDSLYLFNTGLRVSQIVAIICVAVSVAVIIYNRLIRKRLPSDLYVNQTLLANIVPPNDETELDYEFEAVLEEIKRDNESL
ncbi:MAG: prolipoprotein diacylglyceryl transferase [Oscillospiraceae bacterium]|jgi:phosphatidylglycerol:prolipoprotein diacylglycerol transferase|nr:prolipoprotein diacylglyceryl transferase [Oscillospiraceae bacterium]